MAFSVPSTSSNSGDLVGTTGLTITKPTGLQDDDVLYAFLGKEEDDGGDFASTGWTLLDSNQSTIGFDYNSAVLRKVISDASGEAANYTFTNSDTATTEHAGIIIIVRGADTSTPEDQTTVKDNERNDFSPDSPTITTQTNGALVVPVCFIRGTLLNPITFVPPSGYNLADSENSLDFSQLGAAYLAKASAGATGALNWPNTGGSGGEEWHTYTLAIKPAAAGGTALPMAMYQYRTRRNN